ncbi:MAG TPA: oligosaccharide flippase family protein [Bradyrhizobium sp.]|uniref:lipopolysaccharide biosynthesis protein n=1 Tax=Bradyrhizobium sp. TaxID=376 RepID=UPI002B7EB645|nr:oligosaccharide flippase family protein [Bradyrhizobium sp.]HLZ02384.1 oligosaccharide flippase family protein [Bradyrhizobium sp.]
MLRHASQYMIASVVAAAFGFISSATFTRLLSPADYGIYIIGVGIAGFVSSILFTWLRFSVMRLQSEGGGRDLRATAFTGYGMSVAAAPLLLFVIPYLAHRGWQEVACAIVLALGIGLVELGQEFMRARFEVREFVAGAVLRTIVSFALCLAAIKLGWGGYGLLTGTALGYYVSAAFSARTIWRTPLAKPDFSELRLFVRLGFVFTITAFVYTFQCSMDRLFLAWHSSEAFSGLYGASADLTRQIIQMPAGSIAAAAFPIAVNSLVQHGTARAREQLQRFGAVLLAVSVPAAVGLALTIPYLAAFLLGPAFRDTAAQIVPMLAIGWLFQCITQYYVHVSFHLAKKPEWSLLQGLASVAINVASIWPLTDAWGLQGTAASFMISEAFGVAVGVVITRFAYPLPSLLGPLARTLLASGLMATAVLVLKQWLSVPGALTFAILAVSGMLVYGLAAIALNICDVRGVLRALRLRIPVAARG